MIKINLEKTMISTILLIFTVLVIGFSLQISNAAETNITIGSNLGQIIANANDGDIINLGEGTYTNNVNNIVINKNITLKGNGPTKDIIINAKGTSRIFTTGFNTNIKFINITFTNGKAIGDGGAILNNHATTKMTFINCSFINNTAASSSITNYDGDGGAIFNRGPGLIVESSNFTNNSGNHINSRGGAIWNIGDDFTLTKSIFINNTAYDGGAVFNDYGDRLQVSNSKFINNSAKGSGYGGAIHNYGRGFTVTNSSFTNSCANSTYGGYGGALTNSGVGFSVFNSNFTNNNAPSGSGGGYGGAIYNSANTFTVKNSIFIGNNASSGGALINRASAPNSSIINSTFTDNTGFNSAAFNNEAPNFTVANSSFTNNKVNNIAGAVSNSGANFTVLNSIFINNKAPGNIGGAIRNTAGNMTVNNCSFKNNTGTNGGAIHSTGAGCNVTNSTFIDNSANNGGSIYNSGSMMVSGNTMTNNQAILGNMIYNAGKMGTLKLTFINNSTIKVKGNQIILLFATLTDDMGNTITGQNINFKVNETSIGNKISTEGYAAINYTTPDFKGMIPVTGNYLGHLENPINLLNGELIIQIPTNSTIVVSNNTKVGKTVNITGKLRDEDGNFIANAVLKVTIGGETFTVTTNGTGDWSQLYTPKNDGIFNVSVEWEGNDYYLDFINSTSFNVVKLKTNTTILVPENVKVGETVNITGILRDEDNNILANTKFNVTIEKKIYTIMTDNVGRWSLSYTATQQGIINVKATFTGNNIYIGFENMTWFNVEKNQDNETDNSNNTDNNNTNNKNNTNDSDKNNTNNKNNTNDSDKNNTNNKNNTDNTDNNNTNNKNNTNNPDNSNPNNKNNSNNQNNYNPNYKKYFYGNNENSVQGLVLLKETGIAIIVILLVVVGLLFIIFRKKYN